MVGVQDAKECPNCGEMGTHEWQSRTHEEWFYCSNCGLSEGLRMITDKKATKKEGKWQPKIRKDGWPVLRRYKKGGYGNVAVDTGSIISNYSLSKDKKKRRREIKHFQNISGIKQEDGTVINVSITGVDH